MDRKLLDLLACPATRQPLSLMESRQLAELNSAISAGHAVRKDGTPESVPLAEALVTADGRLAYRVDDGIPVLLVEESLDLAALGLSRA